MNNKTEVAFQIIKHTSVTQRLLIKKKIKNNNKTHVKTYLKKIKKYIYKTHV